MFEKLAIPAEYVANLGLELSKNKFIDKLDEKKLQGTLRDYIFNQQKYKEVCSISEEIDFQGLVEYIRNHLIDDAYCSVFAVNAKERGIARGQVVSKAVSYSQANTEQGKKRVAKALYDCIDIIREFYHCGISKQDYILATEIVDAVRADTEEIVSDAVRTLEKKIDNMATGLSNGTMYSVKDMIQDAEEGRLEVIAGQFTKAFEHMSVEHPLYPHYGFTWKNGIIVSEPRTKEATTVYPPKYVFDGEVQFGNQYFTDRSIDLADYSYRHQIPLTINVSATKKFLGDVKDPAQFDAERFVGKEIQAIPPAFPEAVPCSVMVKDKVYFEYILIRMQEVLDDGTLVIGNKGQANCHVSFEFSTKMPEITDDSATDIMEGGTADFNVKIHGATNREFLNYAYI